jgi:hypothetical protein
MNDRPRSAINIKPEPLPYSTMHRVGVGTVQESRVPPAKLTSNSRPRQTLKVTSELSVCMSYTQIWPQTVGAMLRTHALELPTHAGMRGANEFKRDNYESMIGCARWGGRQAAYETQIFTSRVLHDE